MDEELEKFLADSRGLNPTCGCDKRGDRWFCCSYHEGLVDGYEAGYMQGAEDHY